MDVIHSTKGDSPGYTRYFFDEPVGTAAAGVFLRGDKPIKLAEQRTVQNDDGAFVPQSEKPFEIVLHGQQMIEVPSEVKSLELEDGTKLTLTKAG